MTAIRDELISLKNDDELFQPKAVVDYARNNPSAVPAIHKHLIWDDSIAGENYRIWQVRQLIAIHIRYEDNTRQMVSLSIDRTNKGGGYRNLDDVLPVRDLRDVLLDDAFRDLERLRLKYDRLAELASVWAEAEKAKLSRARRPTKQSRRGPAQHIEA